MKFIGRKLYLDWGGDGRKYVIAIEKLPGADADAMGLHQTQPEDNPRIKMKSLLVDVYDCLGERIEHKVGGKRYPLKGCSEFQDYLTDDSCWITVEESVGSEEFRLKNQGKIRQVQGIGDDIIFYVDPYSERRDEITEWCKENEGAEFWKNAVYIEDKDLAIVFTLTFVG